MLDLPPTSTPLPPNEPRRPRDGRLYVVRWHRLDGQQVRHRYYRRRPDAIAFATRLQGFGRDPEVYESSTAWSVTAR